MTAHWTKWVLSNSAQNAVSAENVSTMSCCRWSSSQWRIVANETSQMQIAWWQLVLRIASLLWVRCRHDSEVDQEIYVESKWKNNQNAKLKFRLWNFLHENEEECVKVIIIHRTQDFQSKFGNWLKKNVNELTQCSLRILTTYEWEGRLKPFFVQIPSITTISCFSC